MKQLQDEVFLAYEFVTDKSVDQFCLWISWLVDVNRAYKRTPQTYKGAAGECSVVDKVLLTSNDEQQFVVKCLIRQTRRPEVNAVINCM